MYVHAHLWHLCMCVCMIYLPGFGGGSTCAHICTYVYVYISACVCMYACIELHDFTVYIHVTVPACVREKHREECWDNS